MTNLSWTASSPIRYFNFQFIANQDCSFQQDDIKFLFAALLTKTNKCTLLTVPFSRTFLIGKSFYEHCWQLVLLTYFPPCSAICTLLTMICCQKHCLLAFSQFLTKCIWYPRNMGFTTKDKDNDVKNSGNCALDYKGGWWYNCCHYANPNGLYKGGSDAQGITWGSFRQGQGYSLKHTEIKIRPAWFSLCGSGVF